MDALALGIAPAWPAFGQSGAGSGLAPAIAAAGGPEAIARMQAEDRAALAAWEAAGRP